MASLPLEHLLERSLRPGPPVANDELAALGATVTACRLCSMAESALPAVPGQGARGAAVAVVTDIPHPGRLEATARALGLQASEVYLTSVMKHGGEGPTTDELRTCAWFLRRELSLVAPRVVIAVGDLACGQIFPGLRVAVPRPFRLGEYQVLPASDAWRASVGPKFWSTLRTSVRELLASASSSVSNSGARG